MNRAQRRFDELKAENAEVTLAAVLEDQRVRDDRDANRDIAPLKPATDAVLLDTSDLPLEDVITTVIGWIEEARS